MQIILHIGMPKTGSTALQHALASMREQLLERGILYPTTRFGKITHNFMWLLNGQTEGLPSYYDYRIKQQPDLVATKALPAWQKIVENAKACKPNTVILSGEILFSAAKRDADMQLRHHLFELSKDITVVAYVRRPSSQYLSATQQDLKRSTSRIRSPAGVDLRTHIEAWNRLLNTHTQVFAYDSVSLIEGDITTDFLNRVIGAQPLDGLDIPRISENTTLSAESMAILQDTRRALFPNADGDRFKFCYQLEATLGRIEKETGGFSRPRLFPEVANYIDHSCTDLLWLREEYGLTLQGIDYERIGSSMVAPINKDDIRVADICPVDPDKKSQLQALLYQALHAEHSKPQRDQQHHPLKRWLKKVFG
mgnify:CR=1 FL=1